MTILKGNIFEDLSVIQLQSQATQTSGLCCPRCQTTNYMKFGKTKQKSTEQQKQRYRCKQCGKTFYTDHGTPYYRLRKREHTVRYLQAMIDGMSIRKAAKHAGISIKTSFQWRHKFLSSINKQNTFNSSEAIGIHELKLPYSSKGKHVDSNKQNAPSRSILQISASGKISLSQLQAGRPVRSASNILSAESGKNLYSARPSKLITSALIQSGKINSLIKDREISNALHNEICLKLIDIKEWMAPFRGIATKYLAQYWGWYTLVSTFKTEADHSRFIRECTSARQIWTIPFST